MYATNPGLIIGFHGCDMVRQQELLAHNAPMPVSDNDYEWLGHGMYFWENNYDRAMQWAEKKYAKDPAKEPAVIGAVIDLGYCCDLLDKRFITTVQTYYTLMKAEYEEDGRDLPVNENLTKDPNKDKLLRKLDCSVLEFMHSQVLQEAQKEVKDQGYSRYKLFDSVRGVFTEGDFAFPGAGFYEKSHLQICVRNPNSIKGFFLKRDEIDFWDEQIKKELLR